jgi:pimeloyl-ACP methyl ester carboxylesterase
MVPAAPRRADTLEPMSPTVQAGGVELAYRERGDGPAVLLVHGMADDSHGWDEVIEGLPDQARVIAYDRRGYGGSGAPEPYGRTTVNEQAEDAAALLRQLDAAPAIVCGADLGALVCLDLIQRHRSLVRAGVLLEPPLYAFSAAANEALAAERQVLEQSLRDGGPEDAVSAFLENRGADPERHQRARTAARAFFADYAGLASWPVTRRQLRALAVPLAVLTGPSAQIHARQAADALAALVPGARRIEDGSPAAVVRELLASAS